MTRDRSSLARGRAPSASLAEMDGLGAAIAAAAALAERVRSDAAGMLLRRAAALVADRCRAAFDGAERDEGGAPPADSGRLNH